MTKRPNIVLILPDQLRRDMCGCYGGQAIPTPGIDRLSAEGLTVDNAISPCPVCTPYRGMLMTGRYPTHTGILNNFLETNPALSETALATTLRAAGYDTAYIGKWHLAAGEYAGETSDPSFVPPGPSRLGFRHWQAYNFHMEFNNYWYYEDLPEKIHDPRYETDVIFQQATDFLAGREPSGNPVFMVISPHPPHPPFGPDDAPPGYLDRVPEDLKWPPNVPDENPRRIDEMRTYLSMVLNLDDNVAHFTDFLDTSGLSESTLLIFTSDHGEMHGSHGRLHKMVPYAEAIDLPLVLRWPGTIRAGKRLDVEFGPTDYLPTLCSLTGANPPDDLDGVDLSDSILAGGQTLDRDMLIMNYSSHWNYFRSDTVDTASDWRCWPEWRGVRNKRFTYVKWLTGREEFYDNESDPYQMTNLVESPEYHETIDRHRRVFSTLMAEAHDDFLPGTEYAEWFDDARQVLRTGLGPVSRTAPPAV